MNELAAFDLNGATPQRERSLAQRVDLTRTPRYNARARVHRQEFLFCSVVSFSVQASPERGGGRHF